MAEPAASSSSGASLPLIESGNTAGRGEEVPPVPPSSCPPPSGWVTAAPRLIPRVSCRVSYRALLPHRPVPEHRALQESAEGESGLSARGDPALPAQARGDAGAAATPALEEPNRALSLTLCFSPFPLQVLVQELEQHQVCVGSDEILL